MKMIRVFLLILTVCLSTNLSVAKNIQRSMKKLMNAQFAVSEFYVDSVNDEKVVEDAIRGMLD